MYMPYIKFQDSSISRSGVSQLPKSVMDRRTDVLTFVYLCVVVVVVALLFYVHGKHLRSCWDGQLT